MLVIKLQLSNEQPLNWGTHRQILLQYIVIGHKNLYTDIKNINLDLFKIISMELLFKILENKMQTEKPVVER